MTRESTIRVKEEEIENAQALLQGKLLNGAEEIGPRKEYGRTPTLILEESRTGMEAFGEKIKT